MRFNKHQLWDLMWFKQCHKTPMTGNDRDATYKDGDDGGMVNELFV